MWYLFISRTSMRWCIKLFSLSWTPLIPMPTSRRCNCTPTPLPPQELYSLIVYCFGLISSWLKSLHRQLSRVSALTCFWFAAVANSYLSSINFCNLFGGVSSCCVPLFCCQAHTWSHKGERKTLDVRMVHGSWPIIVSEWHVVKEAMEDSVTGFVHWICTVKIHNFII